MIRQTSIDAYNAIRDNGLLSERRWQVYDVLYDIGPATGGEVFKEFKKRYGITAPTNSNVTTRLGELRQMTVVMELGVKACTVSGQRVILWDVTANLPLKFEKSKRVKCTHCDGKGYFETQQTRLF